MRPLPGSSADEGDDKDDKSKGKGKGKKRSHQQRRELDNYDANCGKCGAAERSKRDVVMFCDDKHDGMFCSRTYHVSCLNRKESIKQKWSCPWHFCEDCTVKVTRAVYHCVGCSNAYCAKHLSYIDGSGEAIINGTPALGITPKLANGSTYIFCSHCAMHGFANSYNESPLWREYPPGLVWPVPVDPEPLDEDAARASKKKKKQQLPPVLGSRSSTRLATRASVAEHADQR